MICRTKSANAQMQLGLGRRADPRAKACPAGDAGKASSRGHGAHLNEVSERSWQLENGEVLLKAHI